MKERMLAIGVALGLIVYAHAEVKPPEPDRSVEYKKVGDASLKLHIFNPEGHKPTDQAPAIVFFHGGGWRGGGYTHFSGQCDYFASRGMVAMTATYRTEKPHGTTPRECVKDAKSAIRWVRAHADELGIDPERLAAGGGSAGGHMAAATAMLADFNEEGEDGSISCIPNALVLFNPVADNSPAGFGHDRVKAYWEAFSPLHNIHKGAPPTVILTGSEDTAFKVASAEAYKDKMEALGRRCDLKVYEGQPHAFFNKGHSEEMYFQTMLDADRFLVSIGYLTGEAPGLDELMAVSAEEKANAEMEAVAAAAVEMGGGEDAGPLPTRYRLAKPAPFPAGGEWFKKAGLGLFIHWGPASVPDIEDVWRIRQPVKDSNPLRPKVTPEFYYNNAPKGFTADKYDPEQWMDAAKKAGFRYAVLTSKHHDGYSLWPSEYTDLGVQSYLNGRDLLQPYVDALRDRDMHVGFYFSGVDWHLDRDYMNYYFSRGKEGWDFYGNPMPQDAVELLPMEIIEQKKKMVFEVMERYRPDLWWWDSGLPLTVEETAGKYNPDMIFNNRGNWYHGNQLQGTYPVTHYATPEGFPSLEWKYVKQLIAAGTPWEICMTSQLSGWFYYDPRGEQSGALEDIMYAFARVRSWQGNLLLNISPRADGTLPDVVYENFEKMGRWMEWGAVSMFDTKGTHFPEKANVPITTSGDGKTWYLHARPGQQAEAHTWGKWKKIYYAGTEPGKPIRVIDVPEVKSVRQLRTGKAVGYTYEKGILTMLNPDAGPDGLHEVIVVEF